LGPSEDLGESTVGSGSDMGDSVYIGPVVPLINLFVSNREAKPLSLDMSTPVLVILRFVFESARENLGE